MGSRDPELRMRRLATLRAAYDASPALPATRRGPAPHGIRGRCWGGSSSCWADCRTAEARPGARAGPPHAAPAVAQRLGWARRPGGSTL